MPQMQLFLPRRTWTNMCKVKFMPISSLLFANNDCVRSELYVFCICNVKNYENSGPDDLPNVLHKKQQQQHKESLLQPAIQCTHHMCPIKVHWHVKVNYREYWRVKITITNFNYVHNYSQWSLVVLHPNLRSVYEVYSFNYKPLNQYGDISKKITFSFVKNFIFFFNAKILSLNCLNFFFFLWDR